MSDHLLEVDTTVILTSVVSDLDHKRVELFLPLPRRLFKSIEGLN